MTQTHQLVGDPLKQGIANVVKVVTGLQAFAAACVWFFPGLLTVQLTTSRILGGAILLQLAIILVLMFAMPSLPSMMSRDKIFKDAIDSSRQLLDMWSLVWTSWLVLYVIIALEFLWRDTENLRMARDACNLVNAALLFLTYWIMVRPSTGEFKPSYNTHIIRVLAVCGVLVVAEWVAAGLFADVQTVKGWFDALNGVISGVAVALIVGRLDSRLIGAHISTVIVLYAWAVIQFGYVLLAPSNPAAVLVIVSIALVGKVVLFDTIYKLAATGRLTFYMKEYRTVWDSTATQQALMDKLLCKGSQ